MKTGYRRVMMGEEEWGFRVGRGHAVILAPSGRRTPVTLSALTGRHPDVIEKGQWKRTSDGMVTPMHIKAYIQKHRAELVADVTPSRGVKRKAARLLRAQRGVLR